MTILFVTCASASGAVHNSFRRRRGSGPERRTIFQGKKAVQGRMRIHRIDTRPFTLFHLKMVCCATDTVLRNVRVVLKGDTLSGLDDFDWGEMKGQARFVPAPNSERYIPVITAEDIRDIRKTRPGAEHD